jgi:hypothetical protein
LYLAIALTVVKGDLCPMKTSHSAISAPAPRVLHCTDDLASKILENVRDITDCVAVREEVPAAGAIAVVVEPRAENEVGGSRKEEAVDVSAA